MKSHFNLKSLAFYGVAIGSVLLLFNVVTAYGERNLKAPASINGRYRLSFAEKLPTCSKSDPLLLNIEQSGVYVNASLLPPQTNAQMTTSAEEKHTLTGLLKDQQLSLSGSVPQATVCAQAEASGFTAVAIKGRVDGVAIAGQLSLHSASKTAEFTAQREDPVQPSQNSTSH